MNNLKRKFKVKVKVMMPGESSDSPDPINSTKNDLSPFKPEKGINDAHLLAMSTE